MVSQYSNYTVKEAGKKVKYSERGRKKGKVILQWKREGKRYCIKSFFFCDINVHVLL